MQIKELKAEGLSKTYSVTIPKEDLAKKLEAKIKEMQPQVSLKGFRPGKVPIAHIRKMFGQSIMKDVVEAEINESTQKAMNAIIAGTLVSWSPRSIAPEVTCRLSAS